MFDSPERVTLWSKLSEYGRGTTQYPEYSSGKEHASRTRIDVDVVLGGTTVNPKPDATSGTPLIQQHRDFSMKLLKRH